MFGGPRHMADDHRGRGAGDTGHIVMLCQPVAVIACGLGRLGKANGIAQGIRGCLALWDWGKIKEGEVFHALGVGARTGLANS